MRLADARRLAMSMPAVTEEPHFQFTSFRVKGNIIATAPLDGAFLHVFVADEDRDPAIELHSQFIEKLLWGGKVRGLKIRLVKADPGAAGETQETAGRDKRLNRLAAYRRTSFAPSRASCHGDTLQGAGLIPPLAGRSPTYIVRQLVAFQTGARAGANAQFMLPVVGKMALSDMIDVAAYAASLDP